MDTLDQTFGNDKGLQKVVDDARASVFALILNS